MSRKSKRAKLILSDEQKEALIKMSQSRRLPLQEVQRSKILLKYAGGIGLSVISKELKTTRVTVYKCIDKALSMGVESALKDSFHRPFDPTITEEAKSWVISLACTKPKENGYAAEFWSRNSLAQGGVCSLSELIGRLCVTTGARRKASDRRSARAVKRNSSQGDRNDPLKGWSVSFKYEGKEYGEGRSLLASCLFL